MPGSNRRRPSFRQLYDTTKAAEPVDVVHPLTTNAPETPLQSSARALEGIMPGIQERLAAIQAERDKRDSIRALQDRYAKGAQEGLEDPKVREQFFKGRSSAYVDSWMKTHYAISATEAFKELQTHIAENKNKPGFDVDQAVDAYVGQTLSSMDDPTGVEIFANKLIPLGEKLKQSHVEQELKQLQAEAEANMGALASDAFEVGAMNSLSDLQALVQRGTDLNLSVDQARAIVVEAGIRQAVAHANPLMLAVFFEEDEHGRSLANNPLFADTVMHGLEKAQAELESRFSLHKVQIIDAYTQRVESGAFSMNDVRQIAGQYPDVFSEEQLANMLSQSRRAAEEQINLAQLSYAALSGGLGSIHGLNQGEIDQALEGAMAMLQEQVGPEQAMGRFIEVLNRNGLTYGPWKTRLTNWGRVDPDSFNGEVPQEFLAGHGIWKDMRKYSDMAERHVTDNTVYDRYAVFDAFLAAGETQKGAYMQMLRYTQSPIDQADYNSSELWHDVRSRAGDLAERGIRTDTIDKTFIQSRVMSNIDRFARMGLDAEKAIELGVSQFEHNFKFLRNAYVYTGGREIPAGAGDAVDHYLKSNEDAIKQYLGTDEVDLDSLVVLPDFRDPSVMHVYEDGIHPIPDLSFHMGDAMRSLQESRQIDPQDAVGALSENNRQYWKRRVENARHGLVFPTKGTRRPDPYEGKSDEEVVRELAEQDRRLREQRRRQDVDPVSQEERDAIHYMFNDRRVGP